MRRIAPAFLVLAAVVPAAVALAATVTRTSRPVRLLRTWEETIKAGGREFPRRVEVVFDYGLGVARENYYTLDGELTGSRKITQNMPRPSREELTEALAVVHADPELDRIASRRSAIFEGGFALEEGRGERCGPGSRCVQIQLISPDRVGLIRWVVVDLVKRETVYRAYTPGSERASR